jgi:hypothetical protein
MRADYYGGAYIDLTFGGWHYGPTEVINVWDYATGAVEDPALRHPDRGVVRAAVRAHVEAWIRDQYAGYIENARY